MGDKMVQKYGDHWERSKMFNVEDGRVEWSDLSWPDDDPPLKGAKGLYVLYKDDKPIYVGVSVKGEDPIAERLHAHTKDWLAPWWDSVCWYDFGDNTGAAEVVESLMIAHGTGLWNGSEPGGKFFGDQVFLEKNYSSIELWKR